MWSDAGERAPVAYETLASWQSTSVSTPAAFIAARNLSTRSRRMRARSSVQSEEVMRGLTLLRRAPQVPLRRLQVHRDLADEPIVGVEDDGFGRLEAGVAVVDGLPQLDGHRRSRPEHAVDVELIATERGDGLAQERRVRLAPAVLVAVRTHAHHVGRERCRDRVPVVRGEAREIAVDYVARDGAREQRERARIDRHVGDRGAALRAHLLRGAHEHTRKGLRI